MPDLLITYPAGSTSESSTVVAVGREGTRVLFAVERTPCHPESPRWPDQPADRCLVEALQSSPTTSQAHTSASTRGGPPTATVEQTPVDCKEGFLRDGRLGLGDGRLGLEDPDSPDEASETIRCVVHSAPEELTIGVGDEVRLSVDADYRERVSRSHSRCHLISLALNAALAGAWRADKRPPAHDSLGNPDFDKLAIVSSKIGEEGSVDVYRVGRHVRKAGFSAEALDDTDTLAREVAQIAERWLLSSPEIAVTPGRCRLAERRTWSCELPEGTASFPCGGTHVRRLEPAEGLSVALSWDPRERHLRMTAGSGTTQEQSVYD